MQATEVLDPYCEWLDVRIADRPLNAYQLLGLAPGEESEAEIEAAVRRKRDLLRRCVADAPRPMWQHLHREVDDAAETLLDPRRKADYDRRLFPAGVRVDSAQPHGPLTCGNCDETNPPRRVFCSRCGRSLLESCGRCGVRNFANETYCGACGANLKAALGERLENFEARLQEAETLQVEGRFDQALVLLSTMLSTNLGALEACVEQAKKMLRRLPERRTDTELEYLATAQKAEELAESHDYDEAIETLENTPPGLRDAAAEKRLAQWRAARDEIASLMREIRTAVMAKRTDGLLDQVDRLLLLKPGHEQALKLRNQLLGLQQKSEEKTAEQIRAQAKKLLAEHKYVRAVKRLEQTPETARDERFQKLYDFARETAWLSSSIGLAPIADQGLLAAAQRLAKLVPDDPEAAQAAGQVQAVLKMGPRDPRHAAPAWNEGRQTAMRFPVTWLGGFRRMRVAEEAAATVRRNPGCFYVACGLALQGLGLAAMATNLAPKKKKGVMGGVSLFSRKRSTPAAWGIDLSVSGLKAIKLVREGEGEEAKVTIAACVHRERGLDAPAPTEEEPLLIAIRESLQGFLDKQETKDTPICISLGGVQILGRFLRLPISDDARLAEMVGYELRHQIPFPVDELAWDFHAFPAITADDGNVVPEREIVLLAAKRHQLKHPLGALEEAGIELHALQSDATALYNFLRYEFEDEFECHSKSVSAASEDGVFAVVDVGRDAVNFLAGSPRSMWFRSAPIGGDRFTKALVREFRLTFSEAEKLK
ncbi:MAG: pilus assembly protein PilM, partial [Planctomycetes bacterium]|nr:pilus assembly protein PilM [Planctomycetota bacterium]